MTLSDYWLCGLPYEEDDRCLHKALPFTALLESSTKPVAMRATTATCAGCVQRGQGRNTPFSRHGSRDAADDDPAYSS